MRTFKSKVGILYTNLLLDIMCRKKHCLLKNLVMYIENLDAQSKNVDVYSKSILCIFEKSRIFENTSGFFRLYIKIFEYLSQDSRIYIKIFGTYIIQDFRIQQCFTRHSIVLKLFVSRADYFFLFVRRYFFFKEEIVCYNL